MTGTKPLVLIITIAILIGAFVLLLPIIYDKFKDICVQNFEDFIDDLQRNAGCILRPGDGPVERKIDLLNGFSCIDYVFYDETKGELNYKIRGKEQPVIKQTVQCDRDIKYFGFRKEDPPIVSKQTQKQQQESQKDWKFEIEVRNGKIVLSSEKQFMIQDIERVYNCVYDSCLFELLEGTNFRTPPSCDLIEHEKVPCYKDDNTNLKYTPTSNVVIDFIGGVGRSGEVAKECGKSVNEIQDRYYYISPTLTNFDSDPARSEECDISAAVRGADTERGYCCTDTKKIPTIGEPYIICNFQADKTLKFFAKNNGDKNNPKVSVYMCGINEKVVN